MASKKSFADRSLFQFMKRGVAGELGFNLDSRNSEFEVLPLNYSPTGPERKMSRCLRAAGDPSHGAIRSI